MEARFFKPKGWTEEFYDMHKDPDSIDNLIDNPEYAPIIGKMRAGLRGWQEQIHDSGLLPESEMVKRATANNTTIYEMVRDPGLYNLAALLNAADLALEKNAVNLPALKKMLKNSDCGLRYWGIVGCFLLNDQTAGKQCLKDDSHEVRAMAAWLLINLGETEEGFQCLENLIKEESYALLKVLNIADWIGDDAKTLLPAIQAITFTDSNAVLLQDYANIQNYQKRMQEYLLEKSGIKVPVPEKKKKNKQTK